MSSIADLANGSGLLYVVDTNGTDVISSMPNTTNNVRKIFLDAVSSGTVPPATGVFSATYGRRYFLNSAGGAVQGDLTGAIEISTNIILSGLVSSLPVNTFTISGGVLTITRNSGLQLVNVETEGLAASDDLDSISTAGFITGDITIFRGVSAARVSTFKNLIGNVGLANSTVFLTGDKTHSIILQYDSVAGNWFELSRTPNPTINVATLRAGGIPEPISGVNKTTLTAGGGTINLEPGVDKGYQVYDGTAVLAASWNIQIQPVPSTPYLDGDKMIVDYRSLLTVGANSVTIFGIALTATQALEGRVVVMATYRLSTLTWYYDIFYGAQGVDITNKAYVDATFEPVLGNPAANGYILSSTTGGVRSWIPNPGGSNLWEVGAGAGSIQTLGNGANASAINSFAAGFNSVANSLNSIAIGTQAEAQNGYSIAIGPQAIASGVDSLAIVDSSVAAGDYSIAIGQSANTVGAQSIAIGFTPVAAGTDSVAIGNLAQSTGINSIAVGSPSSGVADYSIALGFNSGATIIGGVNISGTIITKKTSNVGSGNYVIEGSAAVVTITTEEIDLKAPAADYTLTIPSGAKFYPDEVDLILTTIGGTVTAQPFVRAGITGTLAKLLAIVQTTALTATLFNRQRYQTLLSTTGESTLTFGVTTPATGSSTIMGRAVFRGILVENE